jgi:hypothetical protein
MRPGGRIPRVIFYLILLSLAFAVLSLIGIAGWEYTNSDGFCARMCHSVHPEEAYNHKASRHANVTCVECHMGRLSMFRAMAVKATHVSHGWAMVTGYDRPLASPSMRTSKTSCERCHSRNPHQQNAVRVRKKYAADRANTETRIYLVLRNIGGTIIEGVGSGLRWHMENRVRFIATDPQKQTIPWVEVTHPDDSTVVYTDTEEPLAKEEIEAAKKHVMNCLDCHNRRGHPFPDPELELDRALAEGRLSRDLPFVKARLQELLGNDFADEAEALRLVEEASAQYLRDFPDVPKQYPKAYAESRKFMEERQQFMADLLVRSKFETTGLSWRTFPDNMGHRNFLGCFRCHDGRHLDAEGDPIRLSCTLCHNIPIVAREGERPPRWRNPFRLTLPSSHRDSTFLADHPDLLEDSCKSCHGELKFGSENTSFCSNSACHGRNWSKLITKSR